MPTYQYACTACEHRFEAVQSFTDSALAQCPECDGRLRKLYGSVGVVFKGSGFYRTDNRSNGAAVAAESSAPAKDSGAKESGNGSGAKESSAPAAKSPAKESSSASNTTSTTPATAKAS